MHNLEYTNRSLFILWGDGGMNVEVLWSNFLKQVKDELSSISYDTWFAETTLYKLEDGVAYIIVPMPIHKKHLQDNYYDLISNKINEVVGDTYKLKFILKEEIEAEEKHNERNTIENIGNSEQIVEEKFKNNLQTKYTFDTFIVGDSNKFAHAAALSVAENPGKMYNPLFIYGNSGLGKTHLMHAIGNYITQNSNKKVLYVTSDDFMTDFTGLSRKSQTDNNLSYIEFFKNKYRNIDVLMIDDIQFLGNAEKTQQEFFHTFNNLYNDSKQIIITSDL